MRDDIDAYEPHKRTSVLPYVLGILWKWDIRGGKESEIEYPMCDTVRVAKEPIEPATTLFMIIGLTPPLQ